MAGYQEEQYWKEKRLYLQADEKEREIKEKYAHLIRGVDNPYSSSQSEASKQRLKRNLEWKCAQDVEFERLTILEPILDFSKKRRLQELRENKQKQKEAEERRRKLELERLQREEEERRKREEEERRLAPIRAKEAAERERKWKIEMERQRREAEERRREAEREENIEKIVRWIVGILVVGVIIALVSIFWEEILTFIGWVFGIIFVIALIIGFLSS